MATYTEWFFKFELVGHIYEKPKLVLNRHPIYISAPPCLYPSSEVPSQDATWSLNGMEWKLTLSSSFEGCLSCLLSYVQSHQICKLNSSAKNVLSKGCGQIKYFWYATSDNYLPKKPRRPSRIIR